MHKYLFVGSIPDGMHPVQSYFMEKMKRKELEQEEKQRAFQNTLLWFPPTQQATKMMMPSHHAFSPDAFHQDPLKLFLFLSGTELTGARFDQGTCCML